MESCGHTGLTGLCRLCYLSWPKPDSWFCLAGAGPHISATTQRCRPIPVSCYFVTTKQAMSQDFIADVERVNRIEAVPTILDVVCRTTGMRFAAVARVTEERWIACAVLDEINFGLKPGGELKVETTICHEIRQSREPVIINNVSEDQEWCGHRTPAMYGFQSYISMPIILADGSFFGTLCAIDPRPARLKTPETIGMFRLFAELIAKSLDGQRKLAVTESALLAGTRGRGTARTVHCGAGARSPRANEFHLLFDGPDVENAPE